MVSDKKEKRLYFGKEFNGYSSAYSVVTTNLGESGITNIENPADLMGDKGLDLMERGILESLLQRFWVIWDFDYKDGAGPGFSFSEGRANFTAKRSEVKAESLRKIFDKNEVLQLPSSINYDKIVLPPNTRISNERADHERTIQFINSKLRVSISIRALMSGPLQDGIWGVFEKDPEDMNRFSGCTYVITVSRSKNLLFSYDPEMPVLDRWYQNICQRIAVLDWQRINDAIEKDRFRKTMSKVLGSTQ